MTIEMKPEMTPETTRVASGAEAAIHARRLWLPRRLPMESTGDSGRVSKGAPLVVDSPWFAAVASGLRGSGGGGGRVRGSLGLWGWEGGAHVLRRQLW